MRKLSDVQNTLFRLRKKYRSAIEKENSEDAVRIKNAIHALEWVLEIQNTPTDNAID